MPDVRPRQLPRGIGAAGAAVRLIAQAGRGAGSWALLTRRLGDGGPPPVFLQLASGSGPGAGHEGTRSWSRDDGYP